VRQCAIVTEVISLVSCVGLAGCYGPSVLRTPTSQDVQAKTFRPEPGRANIYVWRDGGPDPITSSQVLFDGTMVGALHIGNYLQLTVPPGEHTLFGQLLHGQSSPWGSKLYRYAPLILNTDAGANYFVKLTVDKWSGKLYTKLAEPGNGQKAVRSKRRAQASLHYGQLYTHAPSEPEKNFHFVLKTTPCSARIIVNRNGTEQEIGTTPYVFQVGIAGRYEYWPVQQGNATVRRYTRQEYVMYPQESPLVTLRQPSSMDEPPALDVKCTLIADGFKPQAVQRTITFRSPCSVASVQSCLSAEEDVVVGLNSPTKPEYAAKVRIDSVPSGADIYVMSGDGYLGEKLGTTPKEFEVGFANKRSPDTGSLDPVAWSFWGPTKEKGFVTWADESPPALQLNIVLLKEGYARQDVTRWTFYTPDAAKLENTQKTITIPLKTHDEARQERIERIEQARTQLAAALRKTELDLKQAEISNQQELIRQQGLISKYLAQLNTAFDRVSTSSPSTIIVKQDPHYNREWQDSMAALGTILRPHSQLTPAETEQNIQALQAMGSLVDLMNK